METGPYPWNGEGFLMVECLSQQRLSVCLVYIYHRLTKNKNKQWTDNTKTSNSWKPIQHMAAVMWENVSVRAHHVPELIEGHDKARANSPQPLEGPDVNFDPYPLLDASVQLPQWTAFTYWRTNKIHKLHKEFTWGTKWLLPRKG